MKYRGTYFLPQCHARGPFFCTCPSYTSDIYMGLIGNACFKGTPGVLKHCSGLPMVNPGGPFKAPIEKCVPD